MDEAAANRDQSIRAAHGTSSGLRSTIRAQRPVLQGLFDTTGQRLVNNSAVVDAGPSSSLIAQAAAGEHQAAIDANLLAGRQAQQGLSDQLVNARSGEAFAVRQARQQYQSDAQKVLDQLLGVAADKGTYTATELGRLVDAARARGVTIRGQNLSHQDRVASRRSQERIAGRKARQQAQKDRFLPLADQNKAHDQVHHALDFAKDFVGHATRQEAARALRQGVKDQTIKFDPVMDPATGKQKIDPKSGLKVYRDDSGKLTTKPQALVPGVPQFEDIYVRAALDVAYDGHLSRSTQGLLHRSGIKVRQLGLPTYQQWRQRNRQPPAAGGAPGQGAAGFPYGQGAGQAF